MEHDGKEGEVKCEDCGGDEFKLFLGDWKLIGKCVKCKKEQEVYSV